MASLGFGFWCCLGRKKGRQDPHARNQNTAPRLHPKGAISSLVYFPSLCPGRPDVMQNQNKKLEMNERNLKTKISSPPLSGLRVLKVDW